MLATGSQDRTIKVWRLPDLIPALTLRGHRRGVWALAFSPVDKALASASGDRTLRLWSLADGACLRTFEGHLSSVLRVEFLSGERTRMHARPARQAPARPPAPSRVCAQPCSPLLRSSSLCPHTHPPTYPPALPSSLPPLPQQPALS